ncbi:hypothetical protein ABEY43_06070 [Priestia megaterium]
MKNLLKLIGVYQIYKYSKLTKSNIRHDVSTYVYFHRNGDLHKWQAYKLIMTKAKDRKMKPRDRRFKKLLFGHDSLISMIDCTSEIKVAQWHPDEEVK